MAEESCIFKESAFRHGFSESDYDEVLRHANLVLRSRRGYRNVYEILGTNDGGDYIHVVTRRYRRGEEKVTVVFHMGWMNDADRRRFRKMVRKR